MNSRKFETVLGPFVVSRKITDCQQIVASTRTAENLPISCRIRREYFQGLFNRKLPPRDAEEHSVYPRDVEQVALTLGG